MALEIPDTFDDAEPEVLEENEEETTEVQPFELGDEVDENSKEMQALLSQLAPSTRELLDREFHARFVRIIHPKSKLEAESVKKKPN